MTIIRLSMTVLEQVFKINSLKEKYCRYYYWSITLFVIEYSKIYIKRTNTNVTIGKFQSTIIHQSIFYGAIAGAHVPFENHNDFRIFDGCDMVLVPHNVWVVGFFSTTICQWMDGFGFYSVLYCSVNIIEFPVFIIRNSS